MYYFNLGAKIFCIKKKKLFFHTNYNIYEFMKNVTYFKYSNALHCSVIH